MNASTTEQHGALSLTWSLRVERRSAEAPPTLSLAYAIEASEEVFVSDRLWDHDDARARIADPFGVYRFVRDGSLRLVFAQAPYPPNIIPRVTYPPLYSRVRANDVLRRELTVALPVDEYSSLDRDIEAPSELETVSRVILVMGYRARSTMTEDPAPPAFESADAGYIVDRPSILISSLAVEPLPVRRRTGYMARYALPGEPPPGRAPYP